VIDMAAKNYVRLPKAPVGDTWELRANPDSPSRIVEPNTVHAALLALLAANPKGATIDQCQAAIDEMVRAQRLDHDKTKHRALTLMRWASVNRGVGYRSRGGLITRL
jgi:hypothetical protein